MVERMLGRSAVGIGSSGSVTAWDGRDDTRRRADDGRFSHRRQPVGDDWSFGGNVR
jgi:hypothetical protein